VVERYRVQLTSAAEKDLKRYPHAMKPVLDALTQLEQDSEKGHPLAGDMSSLRSLDFNVKGSGAFRAAYEADEANRLCLVIAVGPREGFYERLKRRVGR
jgi:mRNA-degrading endonuclease RelE of RelBE toxin-antitoxin system